LIHLMDAVVESFLRQSVGISTHVADVEFGNPSSFSDAGIARPIFVVHLWSVNQDKTQRQGGFENAVRDSRPARRMPSPMLAFRYLVTVFAGEPRDEHELLGRLLLAVLAVDRIDDTLLPEQLRGVRVKAALCDEDQDYPLSLWEAGKTRLGLGLCLSVPAEVGAWLERGAPVASVSVTADLHTSQGHDGNVQTDTSSSDVALRRRRAGSALVMEGKRPAPKEGS
jgi:hypothetical protein